MSQSQTENLQIKLDGICWLVAGRGRVVVTGIG